PAQLRSGTLLMDQGTRPILKAKQRRQMSDRWSGKSARIDVDWRKMSSSVLGGVFLLDFPFHRTILCAAARLFFSLQEICE
ncbi:MAG TPA: hypothetical protein VGQ81_10545, partial [Acidobacteriota bacterium]|nr:hypothetical protein [Acidobacteriota bacterium]